MNLSSSIEQAIERSSLIRKMFEEGQALITKYGKDKVFDFSLGNSVLEPPPEVKATLLKLLNSNEKGLHRYMSNQGLMETRAYIANQIKAETQIDFTADDIVMCAGAASGLNTVIKTLCNPGDEVVVLSPFFMEYRAYIANHGATIKVVETTDQFQIDFEKLTAAINSNTRAVIINSPNNPTGVIYPEADIQKLGELITRKSKEFNKTITLISDEPYRRITFDNAVVPIIFKHLTEAIVVTSYSKDIAIPGERMGYVAVSPNSENKSNLMAGLVIALRTLGFVNAPALFQRVIPHASSALVDIDVYKKNRDMLYNHLTNLGLSCIKPTGAFYLFPQTPIADDMEFIQLAKQYNLLLVPGSAFGTPGYFRISYCCDPEMVKRSLPVFTQLIEKINEQEKARKKKQERKSTHN
jgi:aspartate aminotransferase